MIASGVEEDVATRKLLKAVSDAMLHNTSNSEFDDLPVTMPAEVQPIHGTKNLWALKHPPLSFVTSKRYGGLKSLRLKYIIKFLGLT